MERFRLLLSENRRVRQLYFGQYHLLTPDRSNDVAGQTPTLGDLTTNSGYLVKAGSLIEYKGASGSTANSPDVCMSYCQSQGYQFAGVEYGYNCCMYFTLNLYQVLASAS